MKQISKILIAVMLLAALSGCGAAGTTGGSGTNNGNTVDKVINDQIAAADGESSTPVQTIPDAQGNSGANVVPAPPENPNNPVTAPAETGTPKSQDVPLETEPVVSVPPVETEPPVETSTPADYDLTAMSKDMVYATVSQFMYDPDDYVGKTVRMNGLYYAGYDDRTYQYYQYCLIQDALACCAQGLEFVWDDGSHVYPDEYPAEETEIIVQGVFDIYEEAGETCNFLYCRLKDATMEVAGTA